MPILDRLGMGLGVDRLLEEYKKVEMYDYKEPEEAPYYDEDGTYYKEPEEAPYYDEDGT